jgi:CBS domain-containing protein
VEDIMTEDPLMVSPDVSATLVARQMFEQRVHRVVVVDEEKRPIGIITSLDLLGSY